MSDSTAIDPANFAPLSDFSEGGNDPNVSISQPKRSRGRLNPNSSDAPREANEVKRSRGAPNGNKNALRHGFYAKNLGMASPAKLDEFELRNLMGEVAMPRSLRPRAARARGVKDYMHILYKKNLESSDSIVLTETLRALSLAGMALSRLILVHNQVRITRSRSNTYLKKLFADIDASTSRANRLAPSISPSHDDDDDL